MITKPKKSLSINDLPDDAQFVVVTEAGQVVVHNIKPPIIRITVCLTINPEQAISRTVNTSDEIGWYLDNGDVEVSWTVGTCPIEDLADWAICEVLKYISAHGVPPNDQTKH